MIQSITILDDATFHPENPTVMDDLQKVNYIFGTNGTGKTTISRIIADPAHSSSSQCTWKNGPLETVVLNRDFVEKNFGEMPGVFTLGEKEKETEAKIVVAKADRDKEIEKLHRLTRTLLGEDGASGKKGDLENLERDAREKFWVPVEKIKKEKKLDDALKGVMNDKGKCKSKILEEERQNVAALKDLADLEKRAETIFGEIPSHQPSLPSIIDTTISGHESNPILSKIVIGKKDVDVSAMIQRLENSDWVRQGLPYFEQNDKTCPFCQQATTEYFGQQLKAYFDESFENDIHEIDNLILQYGKDVSAICSVMDRLVLEPGKFLDEDLIKTKKTTFEQMIESNLLLIKNKKKQPSKIITLNSTANLLADIKTIVDAANTEVDKHNKMVKNLEAETQTLTDEVWRYVLNELAVDIKQYQENKEEIEKAISGIQKNIESAKVRIDVKEAEIADLEKQTTSIQPTVNAINHTLKRYGFDNFAIAEYGDGKRYKLVRSDGSTATNTLSEGEKTFVVFLYFYHLINGSFSETGTTTDRVVVFDDPVSSVDSDVLFIVSNLIREVCDNCGTPEGRIKQVFVLTHNVYFHKEVSYNKNRSSKECLSEESFWIVRKGDAYSECNRQKCNPIKTSYELLWSEVQEAESAILTGASVSPRIENSLRRILEYYFTILGSVDREEICAKFEGHDKVICNSLFSWVNAGSHSALDDVYITPSESTVRNALDVFKEIYERTGHIGHYEMMNPQSSNAEA